MKALKVEGLVLSLKENQNTLNKKGSNKVYPNPPIKLTDMTF